MTEFQTSPDVFEWTFPYPSQRMPVFAANLVATSQPLAAQAGLRMLAQGGNAVDAALAAAITLTVVEPTSNGIGGDHIALIWDGSDLHGHNGCGKSPAGWTHDRFKGLQSMPPTGWDSVTVPGAVDAWARISERFGTLAFERLFEPAITYAREGFGVGPMTARRWQDAARAYKAYPEFGRTFLIGNPAPRPGERFRCPEQAETLERIAATGGEDFYRGELADKMVAAAQSEGATLTSKDLEPHSAKWERPLSIKYRGVELHEMPPKAIRAARP